MTENSSNKPKGTFAKLMSSQPTTSLPPTEENKAFRVNYQSVDQSTSQSTDRSVGRSTIQSASSGDIVDRPKAFYITIRLDKHLDDAVRYFQDVHGIKKADRSTVVNAMLDNEENWTDKSLEGLVSRLIGQLTSRLTTK